MDGNWVALSLKRGLQAGCADDISEGLCNLGDGTSDAVELIPLLEQVAKGSFRFFDDNSSGGMPHPTGNPVGFGREAREAIRNIRENSRLESASPIARSLKSLDAEDVRHALDQLANDSTTDETLIPILEKIARKNAYDSYSYIGGRSLTHENRKAAGLPLRICAVCDSIPEAATPYEGRSKDFGAAAASLKRHELDKEDDLWECLECGAFFHWHARRGQLDQETLIRFLSLHAVVLREIVHPEQPAADPAGLAERVLALPWAVRQIPWMYLLQRDRPLARRLVPALVESAARNDEWSPYFLRKFSDTAEDARLLLKALEGYAPATASTLDELRSHARVVSCTTCSTLGNEAAPQLRRNALPENLSTLRQLGASERNDAWECPECASLFHWKSEDGIDGGLTRITGPLADALRKFIHRTAETDERVIEQVFASGPEWQQLLYEHGMQRDLQLVVRLVPHMVSSLAVTPRAWLYETLLEIARDPYGAAAVRAALPPRISRQNREIKSLARRLRSRPQ